ncbi:MAG: efflux RND transporter periplasmic adaptor subunit [Peptostreptococcus sp.]|uniref:efflux RND transporter periplasmic adaptor subunit n=1 Tax=Peptostreptococcus sp. TaxID=1262 RepID=UPI002FC88557
MSLKEKIGDGLTKIKSNKKIQIYLGIVVVAVIVIVAGGIVLNNQSHKETTPTIQTYTIPENEKIFINGRIVPKQSKDISGPPNGETPDVRVSNEQSVKKDDVLYIVKDEAAIQEIAGIKTQIKNLISEKKSLKSDDPSLTAINSQIATLNTSLSTANAKAYTKVKAPFDGKVYLNNNQNQDTQTPGAALMTVQTTDYVMNGQISEQDLSKIKQDMTADITILSTGDTVKGRVNYISERPVTTSAPQDASGEGASAASMSFYSIMLTLDTQDGIIDGYHTQAVIEVNTDKHKVPSASIVNDGNEVYVLAEIDGYLRKINVEILSESGDFSVVSGNLNEDDVIIKNPTKNMKEGDPVTEKPGSNGKANTDKSKTDKSEKDSPASSSEESSEN